MTKPAQPRKKRTPKTRQEANVTLAAPLPPPPATRQPWHKRLLAKILGAN